MSLDKSVGMTMGYGLEGCGSIFRKGKNFSLLESVQTGSGAQPVSYSMGIRGFFTEDKQGWGVKLTTQIRGQQCCSYIFIPR
jgi:hypothetical protein